MFDPAGHAWALPRGLFQPPFQAFTRTVAHVLDLLPPTTGFAQEILANTGTGQGQIIKITQTSADPTRLLVNDAIWSQTPAAAAGEAGSLRDTR